MSNTNNHDAQKLCYLAAILFLMGSVTGVLVTAAFSQQISANEQYMLAAHLNGVLGCFWLLGLAFSLQWVHLSEKSQALLLLTTVLAAFANWLLTLIKSFMNVRGIEFDDSKSNNNLIFVMLVLFVVIPTFISAVLWLKGLRDGMKA